MNKILTAATLAAMVCIGANGVAAQTSSSTANGGAGGTGGAAAGGNATGGTASNNTSGVSSANGGAGGSAQGGTAQGGAATSSALGGSSQSSLGDVTVNLNQASAPLGGKDGLGVGVDPKTGHIVTDNTVNYTGSYKLKNTPDISIGGPASGPCNGFSAGLGFSIAGLSIGGNTSTVDEGCAARETARIAAMLGRMDIANAVLENLPAVQAAMRAKAARESMERPRAEGPGPAPATTTPLKEDPETAAIRRATAAQREAEQAAREAALREQQSVAQEALARQATMAKVNDTLKFTDATTQGNDKTPQEIMADEAMRKLNLDGQHAAVKRQEPQPAPASTPPMQVVASFQPVANAKPDSPKAGIMQSEARMSEKASPMSADDRLKAAKSAMNLQ